MSESSESTLKRLPRLKPRGGLQVMYASIRALFLRELQTRFGHYRLGYLWAFLEPALNVVFMLILFGAIAKRTLPGIEYSIFLINGILPFFVFMRSVTQSLSAIQSNQGLLSYRGVKPIDTVIARTSLETILYFFCYIILSLVMMWLGFEISFSAIPLLLSLWLLLYLFSIGFSCIMMVVGELSSEIGKFIKAIFIIVYFMSGAMIPLHIIPEKYLGFFLWNPIAHILELMRFAVSPSYVALKGVSMSYIMINTLVVVFVGLLLTVALSTKLVKSK